MSGGMNPEEVRAHWEGWAERYGPSGRATTRTGTAKRLEVAALVRALRAHGIGDRPAPRVLEVGCGNGSNAFPLAEAFPRLQLTGLDYVEGMIDAAIERRDRAGLGSRLDFRVADVRALATLPGLAERYDVVLSVRCLINLSGFEEQAAVIGQLARRVDRDGLLLMIENSSMTHDLQNDGRTLFGLERRSPAAFNRFFDENELRPLLESLFEEVRTEDFSSLHDLLLYVLLPATRGGEVEYDHPLVEAATRLSLELSARGHTFGSFGQNRLFVGRGPLGEGER